MNRVVMFTNTFEPMVGGLERSVATAHQDLEKAGHLCRVITPRFEGARESRDGVLRVPALLGVGRKKFSIPLPISQRIHHWLDAIDPQVLHAHQPFLLGETAWRAAQLRGIPLVFTHHTFYERYAHYLRMDAERAERMIIDMTSRFCNRCHLVIAPTQSVRRLLLERNVIAPIEVVPTGIDLAFHASGSRDRGRATLGLQPHDEVVGHVGRLSQEKNLEYLLHAILHVLRARPNAKLLLVGDGDRLEWARSRVAALGLGHRLTAPGMVTGTALTDAYAAMDVFVFSSRSDTQGLVLAEAMAAGVPIVALDAPGASDCIEAGRSGVLLPELSSAEDFAAEVAAVLAQPARREALATHARARSTLYSRESCVRRLSDAYQQALQHYRPVPATAEDTWDAIAQRWQREWTPFWEKMTTALRAVAARSEVPVSDAAITVAAEVQSAGE